MLKRRQFSRYRELTIRGGTANSVVDSIEDTVDEIIDKASDMQADYYLSVSIQPSNVYVVVQVSPELDAIMLEVSSRINDAIVVNVNDWQNVWGDFSEQIVDAVGDQGAYKRPGYLFANDD